MEHYKKIILDTLENLEGDGDRTRADILKDWAEGETGDDFGNMTGSRTCNAWQAGEDLKAAGFPFNDDINELLIDCGYGLGDFIEKGPETIDVIICELMAPQVAAELLEEEGGR